MSARLDFEISEETYRLYGTAESPLLSYSIGKTVLFDSARAAFASHPALGGRRSFSTKSMDHGKLVHALLLGGESLIWEIFADDYKTKAAKEERDLSASYGRIPVLSSKLAEARSAVAKIRENAAELGYHLSGHHEVAVFWSEDGENGDLVECCGMIDDLDGCQIVDVKTCESASEQKCQRAIVDNGYDIQAAAYISGLGKAKPELAGRLKFVDLFVETESPWCVTPVQISGGMLALGAMRWRRAFTKWGRCLREKRWPQHVESTVTFEPPQYALLREAEAAAPTKDPTEEW